MMIEIGGFLALAALMISLFAWLKADVSRLDKRMDGLDKRIGDLDERIGKRLDVVDERLRAVEHGQAKLEGLLEGLREAISGRRAA